MDNSCRTPSAATPRRKIDGADGDDDQASPGEAPFAGFDGQEMQQHADDDGGNEAQSSAAHRQRRCGGGDGEERHHAADHDELALREIDHVGGVVRSA